MIQSEGFNAVKKVDPNIVLKKKDGKEQEIQEGWVGHVIPFDLVQEKLLTKEYDVLREKNNRLSEIPSQYEEIIDSLTEEEKESELLNDTNDAFVSKEVTKKLKELRKGDLTEETKELINKLEKYEKIAKEEKELKKQIKEEEKALHMLTKDTIENLSDEMTYLLLDEKWINNLMDKINNLPNNVINNLVSKIQELNKKYETTYFALENEINKTEHELASMIDDLVGNDFDMKGLSEFKSLLLGDDYE